MLNICLTFLLSFLPLHTDAGLDYAEHLKLANESSDYCMDFFDLMYAHQYDNSTARGYFGVATMMQAKVYANPFTKLSYFNKGKKILETAIQDDQDNVELRFIRFAVQKKVPDLLFYNNNLKEDKTVLDNYVLHNQDQLAKNIEDFYTLEKVSS